jgi:hypothetical protein
VVENRHYLDKRAGVGYCFSEQIGKSSSRLPIGAPAALAIPAK